MQSEPGVESHSSFAASLKASGQIAGSYTEADLVKVFGINGPTPEHVLRITSAKARKRYIHNETELNVNPPVQLMETHGEVDVDLDTNAHDIYQGQLGDCYFDATLAAITHQHKDRIHEMFEYIDVTSGVFRTRWFVAGRWETVSVNAQIPVDPNSNVPYFLWTSSELALWPSILEKSFAKIVGSYKGIEGGLPAQALQQLLGVPVENLYDLNAGKQDLTMHWQRSHIYGANSQEEVWNKIKQALDNNFPAVLGSQGVAEVGYHGISGGHAYTLYGYSDDYNGHGKSVRLRNPWGVNQYNGVITGQNHKIGDFWCTWEEFRRNFVMISFAEMRHGYAVKHLAEAPVSGSTSELYTTFTMTENKRFVVQAVWPSDRIVKAAGCSPVAPQARYSFSIQKGGQHIQGTYDFFTRNALIVNGEGAGDWTVNFRLMSDSFGALPQIALSVYEPGEYDWNVAPPSYEQTSAADLVSAANKTAAMSEPLELAGCADYYQRITSKLNLNVMPTDSEFPENEVSIGGSADCGDAAHGYHKDCSGFNHWQSAVKVANEMNDDLKCFDFSKEGSQCYIANTHCHREALLFCHIVGCYQQGEVPYGYGLDAEAQCCGCNDPSNYR